MIIHIILLRTEIKHNFNCKLCKLNGNATNKYFKIHKKIVEFFFSLSIDKILVWKKFRNQETLAQRKYSFWKIWLTFTLSIWIIKLMISIRIKAHKVDIFILENHVITASWWDSFTIFIAPYRSAIKLKYISKNVFSMGNLLLHLYSKKIHLLLEFVIIVLFYCVLVSIFDKL